MSIDPKEILDLPPGIRELTLDVPESEIREQEKEDAFSRQISIASQALFCFAIILLLLNLQRPSNYLHHQS